MYKTFKYRIYPTNEQQQWFAAHFEVNRFLYNVLLKATMQHYSQEVDALFLKKIEPLDFNIPEIRAWSKEDWQDFLKQARKGAHGLSQRELSHLITELVNDSEIYWVNKQFDSRAMRFCAATVVQAFRNFYQGKGFPKFKEIGTVHSVTFPIVRQEKWQSIAFEDQQTLRLPKKIKVKIVQHRRCEGLIKAATISHAASGKWFAMLLTEQAEVKAMKNREKSIGLAQNTKDFCMGVDTMGKVLSWNFPAQDQVLEKKIRHEQTLLSRKQIQAKRAGIPLKEAKNYQKNKKRLARLYEQRKNKNEAFLQKVSSKLVNDYDVIIFENWSVRERINELKEHAENKAVLTVSLQKLMAGFVYHFRELLVQKARFRGKRIIQIAQRSDLQGLAAACEILEAGREILQEQQISKSFCHF